MVHLSEKESRIKNYFICFHPEEFSTVLSDCVPQAFYQPQGGAHGKGAFIHMSTTLGGRTKLSRKELGLDIQVMDLAVVMPTEVNGTVSGLLKQGDEILP